MSGREKRTILSPLQTGQSINQKSGALLREADRNEEGEEWFRIDSNAINVSGTTAEVPGNVKGKM